MRLQCVVEARDAQVGDEVDIVGNNGQERCLISHVERYFSPEDDRKIALWFERETGPDDVPVNSAGEALLYSPDAALRKAQLIVVWRDA